MDLIRGTLPGCSGLVLKLCFPLHLSVVPEGESVAREDGRHSTLHVFLVQVRQIVAEMAINFTK